MSDYLFQENNKLMEEARKLAIHETHPVLDMDESLQSRSSLQMMRSESFQVSMENEGIHTLMEQAGLTDQMNHSDMSRLENRLSRSSSYLLLNNHKKGKDSGLMEQVKSRVSELENLLTQTGSSSEEMMLIEEKFNQAIAACRNYIKNRHPWFAAGQQRKKMVEAQLESLLEDKKYFDKSFQEMQRTGVYSKMSTEESVPEREMDMEYTTMSEELSEKIQSFESKVSLLKNVAVFRMSSEAKARDLMSEVKTTEEELQKRIHSLKSDIARFTALKQDLTENSSVGDFTEIVSDEEKEELKKRIARYEKDIDGMIPGAVDHLTKLEQDPYVKSFMTGDDASNPQVLRMEREAYEQGIKDIMDQEKMSYGEAEAKYIEERMKAKRPYSLTHLEEVRKKNMKSINEKQMGTAVKKLVATDGTEIEKGGEKAFGEMIEKYWRINRIDENKKAGMSREEAEDNVPEFPITLEEAKQKAIDYLNEVLSQKNDYQIRVPNCNIMKMILENKRFKTQIETKKSYGGLNVLNQRKNFTAQKFGTNPNLLKDNQYEVYGYLSHGDLAKECQKTENWKDNMVGLGVSQYGQMIVKLKKDRMRYRTTMLVGDSLSSKNSGLPILMEDKKDIASIGGVAGMAGFSVLVGEILENAWKEKKGEPAPPVNLNNLLANTGQSYLELQFHGGVSIEDIESISFIGDYEAEADKPAADKEFDPDLLKMCKENGIKAFNVSGGKIDEL